MRIIIKILSFIGHTIITAIKRILGLPFFILSLALNLIILCSPMIYILGVIVVLMTWENVHNALTGVAPFGQVRIVTEVYLPIFLSGVFAKKLCKFADCFVDVLWYDKHFKSNSFGVL